MWGTHGDMFNCHCCYSCCSWWKSRKVVSWDAVQEQTEHSKYIRNRTKNCSDTGGEQTWKEGWLGGYLATSEHQIGLLRALERGNLKQRNGYGKYMNFQLRKDYEVLLLMSSATFKAGCCFWKSESVYCF